MTRTEFTKRVMNLSDAKRTKITDLLRESQIQINAVECELIDTPLSGCLLTEFKEGWSLWVKIYKLQKLFDPTPAPESDK